MSAREKVLADLDDRLRACDVRRGLPGPTAGAENEHRALTALRAIIEAHPDCGENGCAHGNPRGTTGFAPWLCPVAIVAAMS